MNKLLILYILVSLIPLIKSAEYSGFYNVDPVYNGKMFYWFFEAQSNASTSPVILYLTGGPGASMGLSLINENGPFKVNADFTTSPNPYSWNTVANVLYVDSPLGAGFSTVDANGYSTSESQSANRLYSFLTQFFTSYPQYKTNEFYIFGESVSAKTAPNLAYLIHSKNKAYPVPSVKINIKGIGLVSGVIEPGLQYASFVDKAFYEGFISRSLKKQAQDIAEECLDAIECGDVNGTFTYCGSIMSTIGAAVANMNVYDVSKTCPLELAPVCYDFSSSAIYFMLPSTRAHLNIPENATFNFIDPKVQENLFPNWFKSETGNIPDLLKANIRVYVVNGNNDYIGNTIGAEAWVSKLKWKGRNQFNHLNRKVLYVGSQISGYYQTYGGLTLSTVKNAGHFIDMDQPATGLTFLTKFLLNDLN